MNNEIKKIIINSYLIINQRTTGDNDFLFPTLGLGFSFGLLFQANLFYFQDRIIGKYNSGILSFCILIYIIILGLKKLNQFKQLEQEEPVLERVKVKKIFAEEREE